MRLLELLYRIRPPIHLDEVSMKPAHLERWASSAETEGMLMGIEFELYFPSNEETLDNFKIVKILEQELGYSVIASVIPHGLSKNLTQWMVEPDKTLNRPKNINDVGIEIVSPPFQIDKMLSEMYRIINWAKNHYCYTNETTGLHMNISVPDFSVDKLDNIKLAIFMGDQYVLEQFGRMTNENCQSIIERIKYQPSEVMQNVLSRMRQHLNAKVGSMINTRMHRRASISVKDNYVEFRSVGGDWLNQDIRNLSLTAIRFAMALNIACDEKAYKQEYAKKLYKLLYESIEDNKLADLISKYISGEIDDSQLTNTLKQNWGSKTPAIKSPKNAYEYAKNVTKGRFPTGESTIVKNAEYAFYYTRDVINKGKSSSDKKQRWPAAEPVISKNPEFAFYYTRDIINNEKPKTKFSWISRFKNEKKVRWPEAEPYIAQNPQYAYEYAYEIIGGEWPEAEQYIKTNSHYAYEYALNIIGGRWPKAESFIIKSPRWAYHYTKDVINKGKKYKQKKDRWPEAEPYIAKDPSTARDYATNILNYPDPNRWGERYLQGKVQ